MSTRYFPEKFNVITSVDDIGAILNLSRITGESLFSYKKRILESSERLANSSYNGLINGINRELGLDRKEIIEINLKTIISGDINNSDINYVLDTITDNRQYSGTINGSGTSAVNNVFITSDYNWEEDSLIGLKLMIGSELYTVLSNTQNQIVFDGNVSSTSGLSYSIFADWEKDSLNGLALELGNQKYQILNNENNTIKLDSNIYLNGNGSYRVTALRPRIQVTSSRVILYKEYLNEENFQLDIEIPIREESMIHTALIDEINDKSDFFRATDLIELEESLPAKTIKQQDSDKVVSSESVPGTKFFSLENKNIKYGTTSFSETGIFFRETRSLDSAPNGPYYSINEMEGIVKSKIVPSGTGTVSYRFMDIPFRLESTPAVITPFVDEDADLFLFAQKEKIIYEDERDRFISSQPKSNMIEYISELLKVTDQTWGK